ncbi:parallel beta-helix repeat protein [Methanococcus voltae]|uniref:NosD domain-containing protein n=1 Tax=Methanococcus voltae TaxID=2188 RepID=UPI001AE377DD|nr:NosD domain-containing protein [Methanococcus voltae]MBP2143872.1 parallel beta-helix repeat protein [Methanococcus voltae]
MNQPNLKKVFSVLLVLLTVTSVMPLEIANISNDSSNESGNMSLEVLNDTDTINNLLINESSNESITYGNNDSSNVIANLNNSTAINSTIGTTSTTIGDDNTTPKDTYDNISTIGASKSNSPVLQSIAPTQTTLSNSVASPEIRTLGTTSDSRIPITGPTIIDKPGYYYLNNDITFNSNYITVKCSDVIIDGNGYTISSGGETQFIRINTLTNDYISNVTIKNIKIDNFEVCGMDIAKLKNSLIENVEITGSRMWGIALHSCENITIIGSNIEGYGLYIRGSQLEHWNTHTIENNHIGLKKIYYFKNQKGGTVPEDAGQVILSNCKNMKMENLDITKTMMGILLSYSNNTLINNVNCCDNRVGIWLYESNYNNISNSISNLNNRNIYLINSSYNRISDNEAQRSRVSSSIILSKSSNNVITGNTASNNEVSGITADEESSNNLISNNIVNLNKNNGIALFRSTNNSVIANIANSNTRNGIYLYGSNNYTIRDNHLSSNILTSISIVNMVNGQVDNNVIVSCKSGSGISAYGTINTTIFNNTANLNKYNGISLINSKNNILKSNNLTSNNNYGIYLKNSENNSIYNNSLNNSKNTYVELGGINYWNTTKSNGGGNHWFAPNGTGFSEITPDNNNDGFCDAVHKIDDNNIDNLPLSGKKIVVEESTKITINSPNAGTIKTNKFLINVTATDKDGIKEVIANINSANITLTKQGNYYIANKTLDNGDYILKVFAEDLLGNKNSKPLKISINVKPTNNNDNDDIQLIWNSTFICPEDEYCPYLTVLKEDCIYTVISGTKKRLILKYDLEGNLIWNRTIINSNPIPGGHSCGGHTSISGNSNPYISFAGNFEDDSALVYAVYDFDGNLIVHKTFNNNYYIDIIKNNNSTDYYYISKNTSSNNEILISKYLKNTSVWNTTYKCKGIIDEYRKLSKENILYLTLISKDETDKREVISLKYDLDGNLLWNTTYKLQDAYEITEYSYEDGNYMINVSVTNLSKKISLKYDDKGNLLETNSYKMFYKKYDDNIYESDNSVFIFNITTNESNNYLNISNYDLNGTLLHNESILTNLKEIDDIDNIYYSYKDGKLYLQISGVDKNSNKQITLLKFDDSGNLLWNTTYESDNIYSIDWPCGRADGIYVCIIENDINNELIKYFRLLKYDLDGNLLWNHLFNDSSVKISDSLPIQPKVSYDSKYLYLVLQSSNISDLSVLKYSLGDVVDTNGPKIIVNSPKAGNIKTNKLSINVTVTDDTGVSKVTANVDNEDISLSKKGNYYIADKTLSDGNYKVNIYAEDLLGNKNSKTVNIVVKTKNTPQSSNRGHSNGNRRSSDVSPTIKLNVIKNVVSNSAIVCGSSFDRQLAKNLKETINPDDYKIDRDTIVVGGPISNAFAKKYNDRFSSPISNNYPGKNRGVIQIIKIPDDSSSIIQSHDMIYIAGSDRLGTRAALEYFETLNELPEEPVIVEWTSSGYKVVN